MIKSFFTPWLRKELPYAGTFLVFFYFVLFAGGSGSVGSLHALLFYHLLVLALWIMWMFRIVKYRVPVKGTFLDGLFLLLICVSLVSSCYSRNMRFSVEEFSHWLVLFFIFSFVYNHATGPEQIRKLLACLLVPAFLSAMIGIVQYGVIYHHTGSLVYSLSIVYSTFGNPNVLSGFFVMLIPLSLSLGLTAKGWSRLLYFFIFTAFLLCLLFAFSRAGLVTGVLSFVVMLYHAGSDRARRGILFGLPVLLMGLSMFVFLKRYAGSNTERLLMYKSTFHMIRDRPAVGTGPGTFPVVYPEYLIQQYFPQDSWEHLPRNVTEFLRQAPRNPWNTLHAHPHNFFLRITAESGLVYFCVFICMILYGFLTLLRDLKGDLLNTGFLSSITAFLVFGLFDDMFLMLFIGLVFAFLFAFAVANVHIKQQLQRRGQLSYVLLFMLLPCLVNLMKYDLALYYFDRGKKALTQRKWPEAESNFRTALHFDGSNPVYHGHLAYAYFKHGRLNQAIEQYQKASYLVPSYAFYHRNLAILYQRTHNKQKERQHNKIARRLDPHHLTERYHKNLSPLIFKRHVADKPLR